MINKKYNPNLIHLNKLEDNAIIQKNLTNFPLGYIGPDINDETIKTNSNWDKTWFKIVDYSASSLSCFVSGGNKFNFHKVFQNFSFINTKSKLFLFE